MQRIKFKSCPHSCKSEEARAFAGGTLPAEPLVLVHESVLNSPEKPDTSMSWLFVYEHSLWLFSLPLHSECGFSVLPCRVTFWVHQTESKKPPMDSIPLDILKNSINLKGRQQTIPKGKKAWRQSLWISWVNRKTHKGSEHIFVEADWQGRRVKNKIKWPQELSDL